jgi:hypothetical protein
MSPLRFGVIGTIAAIGFIAAGLPAHAVTTTLTIDGSGTPYVENGFQIDPIRIVNGNCDGVSGPSCSALNTNEYMTLSKVGGGAFTLDSFGFEFQGNPSILTVAAYVGAALQSTITFGDGDAYDDKNKWYVVFPAIANITSIVFTDSGKGNIRIDDIGLSYADTCTGPNCGPNPGPGETPIPGAAFLMGSVLAGGAGFGAWRRRRREKFAA